MTLIDSDRALGTSDPVAAEPREGPRRASLPVLIERREELALIEAAWRQAAGGRGTAVVVAGPPGIGKSRLLAEAALRQAPDEGLTLTARCTADPDTPDHWPWRQVLRQLRHAGHEWPTPEPEPEPEPGGDQFPFYDAMVSLIRSIARQRPVAVVIDDAHWADTGSLRLADLLCRSSADAAVLVVVAHRDLEASLDRQTSTLLARIARHGHKLALGGLSASGTATLMARRSGSEAADTLVHKVQALTNGNPFLIEEAVGRLTAERSLAGLDKLPASVLSTVARVLATVGEDEQLALHAAAVIGTPFSQTVLGAVVQDDVTNLPDVLTSLHERGFIEPAGTRGSWALAEPVLRVGVLSQLDAARIAHLHRRAGEALRDPAHHSAADSAEIAAHFVASARHGGPTGPALELCRTAAEDASKRFDHDGAVRWLEDAADLAYSDSAVTDTERVDVLLLLADAQVRAGLPQPARSTFERARRLAEQRRDVAAVARALVGTVNAYRREAGWGTTVDGLAGSPERMVADLGLNGADHAALSTRLVSTYAVASALSFDSPAAQRWAEHATALARESADSEVGYAGLVAARWAALGSTPLDRQRELTDQLLLHAAQTADPEEEWLALRWRLRDALEAGDPDLLNTSVARSVALAERLAQPSLLAQSYLLAATVALIEGRFDDVRELHSRSRSECPELAPDGFLVSQQLYLSWEQGHVDLTLAHALGEMFPPPFRAALECWAEMIRGDAEAAGAAVERFFANFVLEEMPDGAFLPIALCMMAEAVSRMALETSHRAADSRGNASQGLVARAERIHQQLAPLADRCTVGGDATPRVWFGSNHLYLGMLATVLGDCDGAEQHLDAARRIHRRMGARCHLVRGAYWRSHLAARRGDLVAARELLESVVRKADLLSMAAAAADARRDLDIAKRHRSSEDGGSPRQAPGSLPTAPAVGAEAPARWELCRDGDGWRLRTGTQSIQLRDRRGLGYLHTLLGRPGQEVHVLELASVSGVMLPSSGVGPALDEEAKAAYHRRVKDLRDQVAEGERWGDPERVRLAQEELDAIARELARSMGLGGRDRPSDAGERARVSVRKAIRAAIDAVAEVAPRAADHLNATVRTGYYCVYVPDPAAPVTWET